MKAAFYKAKGHSYNWLVRKWEGGPYSHVELVFADGRAASSSYRDKGVRFKDITFTDENWDFIEIPIHLELEARKWFQDHEHCKYDLIGQLRFIISPIKFGNDDNDWWCSEAVAAALGMPDPWRYGPNGLYDALKALSLMERSAQA